MTRIAVVAALWLLFAFVTWNVLFDREVMVAAGEFTRDQVGRAQDGRAPTSIHDGFSPRVRAAARHATLWTLPIVAAGAVSVVLTVRRVR